MKRCLAIVRLHPRAFGQMPRQAHVGDDLLDRQAGVDAAHGLVPEELDAVAVVGQCLAHARAAADGRTVRTNQVLGVHAANAVQSVDQAQRVAIGLAAQGVDVEQRRPQMVIDHRVVLRQVDDHGVVGVRRRGDEMHRRPGDAHSAFLVHDVIGRNMTPRGRPVAMKEGQADALVGHRVRTIQGTLVQVEWCSSHRAELSPTLAAQPR